MSDPLPWANFSVPILRMRQGDYESAVPLYDSDNPIRVANQAMRVDMATLRDTGKVLPTRVWWVEQTD